MAFTGYSLLGRKAAGRGINSWTALMYSFSAAVVFLGVFNFLDVPFSTAGTIDRLSVLGTSWQGWGWMILLAAVPSIGGYGLYTLSLRYLRASVANLIATLEPSMTALLAYLLLGERFGPAQIAGSLLILAGVAILRYGRN
jgi:drug/metabolite transporter (DMT)-like permease